MSHGHPDEVPLVESEYKTIYLLSVARQVHELLAALGRFSTPELAAGLVVSAAADSRKGLRSVTPVSLRDGLVCELVLNAGQGVCVQAERASAPGELVLRTLQDCIFGAGLSGLPFTKLVCSQSYEQALQAQRACGSLLEAVLSPANCFSLLRLGHIQSVASLEACARAACLEHFAQALELDQGGFCSLPEQVLAALLSHDGLVVASELQAYEAIAAWVEADKAARVPAFHSLFVRCVRLGCMSRVDLYRLDQHPLLPSCSRVMKLVAFAYLALCYGVCVPGECHRHIAASSARRQRGGEAIAVEDGRLTPLVRTARRLQQEPPEQAPAAAAVQQDASAEALAHAAGSGAGRHAEAEQKGAGAGAAGALCQPGGSSGAQQQGGCDDRLGFGASAQCTVVERMPSPPRRRTQAAAEGSGAAGRQQQSAAQLGQRSCRKLSFC